MTSRGSRWKHGSRLLRRRPASFGVWLAAAALVLYAVVMLWPYLVATLVRGSAVTAWTNVATAPIQGRAPAKLPLIGTTVGSDGASWRSSTTGSMTVRLAEAALARARRRRLGRRLPRLGARARPPSPRADEALRRTLSRRSRRRDRHARGARRPRWRPRRPRRGNRRALATYRKAATARATIATRPDPPVRRQHRARRRAPCAAAAKRRRAASKVGLFRGADGGSLEWAYADWRDSKTEVKRARLQLEQARRPSARPPSHSPQPASPIA